LRPNRLEGQERSDCLKGILLNPLLNGMKHAKIGRLRRSIRCF
jgi:hypothetical protein